MSLIKNKKQKQDASGDWTPINFCCAATLLGLDESTVRKGKCGTDKLTRVEISDAGAIRKRYVLIFEEVLDLKAEWYEKKRVKTVSADSGKTRTAAVGGNKLRLVR